MMADDKSDGPSCFSIIATLAAIVTIVIFVSGKNSLGDFWGKPSASTSGGNPSVAKPGSQPDEPIKRWDTPTPKTSGGYTGGELPQRQSSEWQPDIDWGPLNSGEYTVVGWDVTFQKQSSFGGTISTPILQVQVRCIAGLDRGANPVRMVDQLQKSWNLLVSFRDRNNNDVVLPATLATTIWGKGETKTLEFSLPENYRDTISNVIFGGQRTDGSSSFK